MISEKTYVYLSERIAQKVLARKDIEETLKYARGNGKPSKGVTAHLSDAIEDYVYRDKDKCILVDERGDLYAYNSQWWERIDQKNFLREVIKRVLCLIGASVTYRTYAADTIAKECVSGLTASDDNLFVADRRYIGFRNGIFDTKNGDLKDFHPRYKTDLILDFAYKPDKEGYLASNPDQEKFRLWDRKISEIFDNKEFHDAFQMFCGSLLADRRRFKIEYICFLEGPGANGKSVAAHAVANMFGERYFSKNSPAQLLKRGNQSDYFVADMRGKLCNLCDDIDDKVLQGGEFKRMVSGEAVTGRKVGEDPMIVRPPLFLVCTNLMPQTDDDSYGHHRRLLRLLTTRRRFGEDRPKDPQLTAKLEEEPCRQRIFNWVYQGYRKVMASEGDIPLSAEVKNAMTELMEDSTPMRRWRRDRGFVGKKKDAADAQWVAAADLLADFRMWCLLNGYDIKSDTHKIGAFMRGIEADSKRRGTGIGFFVGNWMGVLASS